MQGTDALIVTLKLTETQRASRRWLWDSGGDGSALVLDAFAGAVMDIGRTNIAKLILLWSGLPRSPNSPQYFFHSPWHGILTIEASESVDQLSVVSGITIRDVISGGLIWEELLLFHQDAPHSSKLSSPSYSVCL